MGRQFIFLFLFIFIFSCNQGKKKTDFMEELTEVKNGMSMEEVIAIADKPGSTQDLGLATSETGDTSHFFQWFYGVNQSILFTNGKVSGVDLDIKATQERIQHIMDSAKTVDAVNGGVIIQRN